MNISRYNMTLIGLAVLLATAAAAHAQTQENHPTIAYVYPAGGKQGTTFEVTVGGQFLQGVASAAISGKGVRAEMIERLGPLPQKLVEELREKARELRQRRQAAGLGMGRRLQAASASATRPAWSDDDEKDLAQVVEKLENSPGPAPCRP